MLFDTVVRYGQQHNQRLEAENEAPLTHPTQLFYKYEMHPIQPFILTATFFGATSEFYPISITVALDTHKFACAATEANGCDTIIWA
ncbi:hypothetical protein BJP34_15825 [Moorena producens PAL-8-15-08-1]|uniref:Uncharacterized protein n=1 Tax=Moorena producens PAL-8-15-08-1 TaxID=1458985 RepID=A0A1D8TSZ0_9CYAN|nr:hypothetical protein BJP34_15825 [Moorena producens PAL-8-15-08-1]